MPLNDSQLVGLLQLMLLQHKDMMVMKAHVLALETIAVQLAGDDVKRRLAQEQQEQLASKNFDSARELVLQLEQAIAQLLPTSGATN